MGESVKANSKWPNSKLGVCGWGRWVGWGSLLVGEVGVVGKGVGLCL